MSHSYDNNYLLMTGMEPEVIQNKDNVALWISNDSKYKGFIPAKTSNGIDYSEIAYQTAAFALSVLDSPLSFALSVLDFVQGLGDAIGSSDEDSDFVRINSQKTMWLDDMGQFLWFIVERGT